MPAPVKKPDSAEHVYGATAALRQRRFPLKTSYLRRRTVSSSTAPGRQQTLTQIDFATSLPHGKERKDCFDNDEAWEEQRPKKRRKVSERHVKGQQTLTQIDFGRRPRCVDHEMKQCPAICAVGAEQIPQETFVCATPSGTTRHRPTMGELAECMPVSMDPCKGAHLSLKQKDVLDRQGSYEGQQDNSQRETVEDRKPGTYKLHDSATPVLGLSGKRELEGGGRSMRPPVTPRKPQILEIPSSQSPSATPLAARTLLYSTHVQRSPLQEISLNIVPHATSPTKITNATKSPFRFSYKHAPSPQPDPQRSGGYGHVPKLASKAVSVSRMLKYPADEENKENEELRSHDKSYEAGADDHTKVSNGKRSPTLYRCSSSLDDYDQTHDFEMGESIMVGPVTQDMRRYDLLSRSQRQLMAQTQSRNQLRCMGPPEESPKLSIPHSAHPPSRPFRHGHSHPDLPMPLKIVGCDLNTDAEILKCPMTARNPLVPSSQATTLDINPPSPELARQRGHVTHEPFTDAVNQPPVTSCSPQSRQAFTLPSPALIPSSLPMSFSSSPSQMRSETSIEQLPILPAALGDADLTVSQLLPESLMNAVLPPPPALSQESIDDEQL